MTIEQLAAAIVDICEAVGVEHMITGALAYNRYGIPRSTKDVDVVLDLQRHDQILQVMDGLGSSVVFDSQVQFDTLTWGKRQIGVTREDPPLNVELFEVFDDPFVQSQFGRRKRLVSAQIGRTIWLPTPEDVVVQKLRWARPKDLDDARDILAVQGTETLDMDYIHHWCAQHATLNRLAATLERLPPH